jgi:hypothetical protein
MLELKSIFSWATVSGPVEPVEAEAVRMSGTLAGGIGDRATSDAEFSRWSCENALLKLVGRVRLSVLVFRSCMVIVIEHAVVLVENCGFLSVERGLQCCDAAGTAGNL